MTVATASFVVDQDFDIGVLTAGLGGGCRLDGGASLRVRRLLLDSADSRLAAAGYALEFSDEAGPPALILCSLATGRVHESMPMAAPPRSAGAVPADRGGARR